MEGTDAQSLKNLCSLHQKLFLTDYISDTPELHGDHKCGHTSPKASCWHPHAHHTASSPRPGRRGWHSAQPRWTQLRPVATGATHLCCSVACGLSVCLLQSLFCLAQACLSFQLEQKSNGCFRERLKAKGEEGCRRWDDSISDSVDMNLGKLWKIMRDREAGHAADPRKELDTT